LADEPLLCGIDAGTSRVRVLLFDTAGRPVAEAAEPTPTRRLGPGRAEHDPEALWACVLRSLRAAAAQIERPARIRSLAVASVGEAGVLVDAEGRTLCPILAWYDTRTAPMLDRLLDEVGFARLHGITGLCPDPTFSLVKLAWLRRHLPEAVERAVAWLNVGDFIAWRLGGRMATDLSLASRTMALDLAARAWSEELLAAAGVPLRLMQPLTASGAALGTLAPDVAAATGLAAEVVVGSGGHDHFCGMLAVGADRPGVVLDSMGTAEALTFVLEAPSADPALAREGFNQGVILIERPHYYLFGGLPTSAAAVEWFRGLWGESASWQSLIEEAAAVPPGSQGTLFLPHLRIGSPPFPDPVSRGAFLGLSDGAGRGVLFRALLEGLALDAARMLESMRGRLARPEPDRLVAIGGSTRNALLMRLKASLFERPVEIAAVSEATCLGAAILGGLAAGHYGSVAEARRTMVPSFRSVAPDPAWPEAHRRALREAYAEARAAVRPLHARLLANLR
jgi:xylulokinase